MARFTEIRRQELILNARQRMNTASAAMQGCVQSINDAASNWAGYVMTDPGEEDLLSTGLEFAAQCRELFDLNKSGLAGALDVLAAGMLDGNGQPLTRQALLEELAAVGQ